MNNLAIWPLGALAAGVVLQLALGRTLSRPAKGWLALVCSLAALAGPLALLPGVAHGGVYDLALPAWDRGVPLQFHVDGLSLLFMLMGTGIGSAILLYCISYMEHEESTTRFYALMLTFIAGLVTLVISANLLIAYLSWEVIGLCSYFLVGFWYKERAAANGARKVLVMTHLPGYGFLAAILLLYVRTGTFVWTDPRLAAAFSGGVFLLMLVAAMAKSVIFPLHTWIPEAMNAPTPVSALLHSACYVKAGVYLLARMYSIAGAAHWPVAWNTLVLALGCATMLVGSLFALAQTDLKRLLAFSTISQLGSIVTALGLGTSFGVGAGLFYCLSHGLFKGTLFLCAGAVQHSTGTRDMRQLGGLADKMPGTARAWLIAAAALSGVPLTNGFVAKWLFYSAAMDAGSAVVVVCAWLASLLTVFYVLKATSSVFYGEMPAALRQRPIHDAAPAMQAGMGVLAALCLVFGLAPQVLINWVVTPAVSALNFMPQVSLSWLGLQAGSGSLPATAGAAIVLLAALAGWGIYQMAGSSTRHANGSALTGGGFLPAPVSTFTGGDPLPAGNVVGAIDFADLAENTFQPIYTAADPDPIYLAAWHGVVRLAGWVEQALARVSNRPLLAGMILTVVVCAIALIVGI